jgi:twitching motility protein PilI
MSTPARERNSTLARSARVDLRTFQQELAARLASRPAGQTELSRLAFTAGDEHWMARLADTGEVLAVPPITPVPLTRPWYLGIANVRGNLHGIVDFSAYLGGRPAKITPQARVLLLGPRLGELKVGLLLDRVIGLRGLASYEPIDRHGDVPAWYIQGWRDEGGTQWQEIDLGRLAREPAFLHIGR